MGISCLALGRANQEVLLGGWPKGNQNRRAKKEQKSRRDSAGNLAGYTRLGRPGVSPVALNSLAGLSGVPGWAPFRTVGPPPGRVTPR
jgi:hypothetical protein